VEIVAEEGRIDVIRLGSMTFKREDLQRGFEPDSCFYIQHRADIAGKDHLDLLVDPPPDLVIEVEFSSTALEKVPLYAALGVPELWRYTDQDEHLTVLRNDGEEFRPIGASIELPPLTADVLTRFVASERNSPSTAWLRDVRAWVRTQAG